MAPEENAGRPESGKRARFPRSARLLRHADFEQVYKLGKRHFAAHMTVFYLARSQGAGLRVGFTVSRALGGAVQRNRMKRRLREAVRLRREAITASVDVVINPKKNLLTADFNELLREVQQAFAVIQKKMTMAWETPAPTIFDSTSDSTSDSRKS